MPSNVDALRLRPLISAERIQKRLDELAAEIDAHYQGDSVLAVCVLKGGFMFFSDLVKRLTLPLELDFLRISSYGQATRSSGELRLTKDSDLPIRGSRVLLIDDIIDTGRSMDFLYRLVLERDPATLDTCVLVDKHERREIPFEPDFVGFPVAEGFIVGYGMDCAEQFRNLDAIYVYTEA